MFEQYRNNPLVPKGVWIDIWGESVDNINLLDFVLSSSIAVSARRPGLVPVAAAISATA